MGFVIGLVVGLAAGVIFYLTISSFWHKALTEVKNELAQLKAKL